MVAKYLQYNVRIGGRIMAIINLARFRQMVLDSITVKSHTILLQLLQANASRLEPSLTNRAILNSFYIKFENDIITPLQYACHMRSYTSIPILIEYGADVYVYHQDSNPFFSNASQLSTVPAIIIPIITNDIALLNYFIKSGHDINRQYGQEKYTLLHIAAAIGVGVKELVKNGANLSAKTEKNITPLMIAINSQKRTLVEYLVQQSVVDEQVIKEAAISGGANMLQLVLGRANQQQIQDMSGLLLHVAAVKDDYKMIRLLMSFGCYMQSKFRQGNTQDDKLSVIYSVVRTAFYPLVSLIDNYIFPYYSKLGAALLVYLDDGREYNASRYAKANSKVQDLLLQEEQKWQEKEAVLEEGAEQVLLLK